MKYALLIGIDNYKNPDDKLFTAKNDCYSLKNILSKEEYGFEVLELTDENATKNNIKQYVEIISQEENLTDFLFYFSGHGISTQTDSFLCTYDFEKYDEGISVNQLARMLSEFVEKDIVVTVFLDACHTGEFNIYRNTIYYNLYSSAVDAVFSSFADNFALFAACGKSEMCSQNAEKKLSEFTIVLIDALEGKCADENGYITITQIYRYIDTNYNTQGWPRAILKASMSSDYYIGSGFDPMQVSINHKSEYISEILSQGEDLINDYIKIGEGSIEEWKEYQFNTSAKKLSNILSWSNSKESKHIELRTNKKYLSLKNAILSRLKRLGSIEPGTKMNDFVFEERIGSGSFGTVWMTKNIYKDEKRAFKVYHSNEIDILEKKSRFHRGYVAMQKINHPNVVKVKEWFEAPLAFDMEYIEGGNLREIKGAICDEESIIKFLITFSEIMSYTHNEGVMHRDIKPENVLAVWDDEKNCYLPVLTDFDLAWFDTATKMTKDALGSLSYAAPEQISSPDSQSTHLSTVDIYSFGQVLYFLVMESDPRQNATEYNLENLKKKLSEWLSPNISYGISVVYEKCTKTNYKDRYQDFKEIRGILQKLYTEQIKLGTTDISEENYIDFVLHGFKSISKNSGKNSFISLTGRSIVTLAIERNTIEIVLASNGLPLINNSSNRTARKALFTRFQNRFSEERNISVEHGVEGSLQIKLFVHLKDLDIDSLDYIRDIISKSLTEMEQ